MDDIDKLIADWTYGLTEEERLLLAAKIRDAIDRAQLKSLERQKVDDS